METNKEEYILSCIEDYDKIVFADIEENAKRKSTKQKFISKELLNKIEQEFEWI